MHCAVSTDPLRDIPQGSPADDSLSLHDDPLKGLLLAIWQTPVGPKSLQGYEQFAPPVGETEVPDVGRENSRQRVEVPTLTPGIDQTA